MADYKYAYNGPTEGTAKAVLKDVGISTKVSIEISTYLRGRNTAKAKAILKLVLAKKHAIPFKRFTDGVGHRKGAIASGRFPEKASEEFLKLIEMAEANAAQAGLSSELIIKHLATHQASTPYRYGRQRRRKMKRSHVEIVLVEDESAKKKTPKKEAKKSAKKVVEVKEAPKIEKPVESKSEVKKETPKVEKKVEAKPVEKKEEAKPEVKEPVKEEIKSESKTNEQEAKQ
jgi:large subunit ribosomal protein L22